jgi:hypothetical protein
LHLLHPGSWLVCPRKFQGPEGQSPQVGQLGFRTCNDQPQVPAIFDHGGGKVEIAVSQKLVAHAQLHFIIAHHATTEDVALRFHRTLKSRDTAEEPVGLECEIKLSLNIASETLLPQGREDDEEPEPKGSFGAFDRAMHGIESWLSLSVEEVARILMERGVERTRVSTRLLRSSSFTISRTGSC